MNRKEIEENLIFLGIIGSQAYGTNLEHSDTDLKGIVIAPVSYHLGLLSFEQKDSWDTTDTGKITALDLSKDKVVYEVKKFLQLVLCQNPNILDLLYLPEKFIISKTPEYEYIASLREFLLSKEAYKSYSGYAHAQIRKMEAHRKWLLLEAQGIANVKPDPADYLPEDLTGLNLLPKSELYAFYEFITILLKDRIQYFDEYAEIQTAFKKVDWTGLIKQNGLSDDVSEYVQRTTNCTDNYLRLLNATQEYNSALRQHQNWKSWSKNRNPERAALERKCGVDGKNAMHCIRLQRMAVEILEEGTVYVYRSDADYLKKIRRGEISYEEIMEESQRLREKAEAALKVSSLPDKVDKQFISNILEELPTKKFQCKSKMW